MGRELDFGKPERQDALARSQEHILRGYRILRDEVGVDNPADNAFLREARICAYKGIVWVGERGGTDARTQSGQEVEIKSTRLDDRPSIQFPTSRYVSETVIGRFRSADLWLFGVFDVYEDLVAIYEADGSAMSDLIDVLDAVRLEREAAGEALQNNPKFPFAEVRVRGRRIFMHTDYEEVGGPKPTIRRRQ